MMGQCNEVELEEIILNVFGEDALDENDAVMECKDQGITQPVRLGYARVSQYLGIANNYIRTVLLERSEKISMLEDTRPGRIGPNLARFDVTTHHGPFIISPDRLNINSQDNFSTMRANVGVFMGKWMYELQLGSKGVMQVGWGTAQCKFSQECGVGAFSGIFNLVLAGDTINSYAYDGNRIRKWNVIAHKYGERWLSGDIIGCTIDLNDGVIEFYRNGGRLGKAFEGICMGYGMVYFPTVTLTFTENLTANFGSTPFRYPIEGYAALQAAPRDEHYRAVMLFDWLEKIVHHIDMERRSSIYADYEEKKGITSTIISSDAFVGCLASTVLQNIGPLIVIPYITEAVFVPFLSELSDFGESSARYTEINKIKICLDLLWAFLEETEINSCLHTSVAYFLSVFRHVSLQLENSDQCKSLILLTNLCQHTATRQHLLQHILFDNARIANFVYIRPLDKRELDEIVDTTWWETNPLDPTVEANKYHYLRACQRIKNATADIETLQVELLVTLLDNNDATSVSPSSRTIFLKKFRGFVQENLIFNRTTPLHQTPLPITLCCFHRLLVAFRILWNTEIAMSSIYIPCRAFYDASINYAGIDRLGGVLSHLNKTYKTELRQRLGPQHEVLVAMDQAEDQSNAFSRDPTRPSELPVVTTALVRIINPNSTDPENPMILERLGYYVYTHEDQAPIRMGQADSVISLIELLDGIILFYHVAAKKQIAKVATLRESMTEFSAAVAKIKTRLDFTMRQSKDSDTEAISQELRRVGNILKTKLAGQARYMAWVRAVVYSKEKQAQLAWLLRVVTLTLSAASKEGNMFSFVPEFYLEAMADLNYGIRNYVHPTALIEDIPNHQEMLVDIALFLCSHFLDPRIIHADAKNTLHMTLAAYVSNPVTLRCLEKLPIDSRIKFVNNLLRPYEHKVWARTNWILVRFWQGYGFAFRYEKSPHLANKIGPTLIRLETSSHCIKPYPSPIYQAHVRNALLLNPAATTVFVNSLLNELNWAFSEFVGALQEIHNVSSRPERIMVESRHIKTCSTCFDLTISLLRVLEMMTTLATGIFIDESQVSSENLLARLCQLLCQILNRVSSPTGCFQHVVLLDISDLATVDHFPILGAVIGILLVLLKHDISTSHRQREMPAATKALLTEPSFQIGSLYFVLGELKPKNETIQSKNTFCFQNYKDDVNDEEIIHVREMIRYLDLNRTMLTDTRLLSDDENICTICYAYTISATFKPCNHRSCRACIAHHLMNSRECFFCKAIINQVTNLEGDLLHDFTNNYTMDDPTTTAS